MPVTSSDTLAQIKEMMMDVFDVDELDIDESTNAADVEEWDSLSHVRLMIAVERKYRFRLSNAEIELLKNVGDLVKLVDAKVG
jgi:acyl carrier protein